MNRIFQQFRKYPLWIKLIVITYSFCLLGATYNHVYDIIYGGFLPYTNAPYILNLYWTALTFLDPLAIILLYVSIRRGIYCIIAIMASDIAINIYATYNIWDLTLLTNGFLQLQILFGILVFITGPLILNKLKGNIEIFTEQT